MDSVATLTPAQQEARTGLLALGQERPVFDPALATELGACLEDGLAPHAARLPAAPGAGGEGGPGTTAGGELVVFKGMLGQILQCERWYLAQQGLGFAWSTRTAVGTVAHKAIELAVFARRQPNPIEAVEQAVDRITDAAEPWGPAAWLAGAPEAELAELRGRASETVTRFFDCFPPLSRHWRPVLEARSRVDLCGGRVVLKGKVDLSLGRAQGTEARVLLVDFKTGAPHRGHVDDLRYYALLETVRSGVPPFRVATYYLDAARWHHEDVTPELLTSAARRVVEGVARVVGLTVEGRPPTLSPGPVCEFCPERADCEGARSWAAQRAARGLEPVA